MYEVVKRNNLCSGLPPNSVRNRKDVICMLGWLYVFMSGNTFSPSIAQQQLPELRLSPREQLHEPHFSPLMALHHDREVMTERSTRHRKCFQISHLKNCNIDAIVYIKCDLFADFTLRSLRISKLYAHCTHFAEYPR